MYASVLLNNADGTFAPAVNYDTATYPQAVAVGDLNGDEWLDLAVANFWSYDVSVLLNEGDGTYAPAVAYWVGMNPYSAALGDLNGDERPDLAVVIEYTTSSDTVSVLLNNGDGTFVASTGYAAGDYPLSLAIGDLNNDARLDLATTARDNVVVLMNQGAERLPGDVDDDDDVDLADLAGLLGAYGVCAGDPNYNPNADFDASGCVDLWDLLTLLYNYGAGA